MQTHPDDARVINETVAGALLRQELGPFNPDHAPPGTKALITYASNSTRDPSWPGSSHTSKPAARGQPSNAKRAAGMVLGHGDQGSENDWDGSEDDYRLGFGGEGSAVLDALRQVRLCNLLHEAAGCGPSYISSSCPRTMHLEKQPEMPHVKIGLEPLVQYTNLVGTECTTWKPQQVVINNECICALHAAYDLYCLGTLQGHPQVK